MFRSDPFKWRHYVAGIILRCVRWQKQLPAIATGNYGLCRKYFLGATTDLLKSNTPCFGISVGEARIVAQEMAQSSKAFPERAHSMQLLLCGR